MADGKWGHCRNCKYFGSPARRPYGAEEARCMQPELSQFQLRIYGSNGCNGWELRPGLDEHIEEPQQPSSGIEAPLS